MEEQEIDLKELFSILFHRIWLIIGVTILAGALAFGFTKLFVKPQYTSSIKMYVNNSTASTGVMTSGDLSAAKSIVDTYITIIESDTVLSDVISRTDSELTPNELAEMIGARSLNNTEVFQVDVTTKDPTQAYNIANSIADTAPDYLTDIVEGTGVKIIDRAKFNDAPVSPNYKQNALIGAVLGFMLACGAILLVTLMDTRVNNEQDLQKISDLPVLGAISDFNNASGNGYGYSMKGGVK